MAQSLKNFVLETLAMDAVDDLNFQFDRTRVYPAGYRRDIARGIRRGSIQVTSEPSRVYRPGQVVHNGAFPADTRPGQVHPFFINPRWTTNRGGRPYVNRLSRHEAADLRGTIIHEATHALQDYQILGELDPNIAEGAAYLAGAIVRRRLGYHLPTIRNPRESGFLYSMDLASRFLAMNRHRRYIVSTTDVQWLGHLALKGSDSRYVFNGI